jgi:nitrate/nitrite transport system substrate-binding protein
MNQRGQVPLEKQSLSLGFVPLTDCAPLVIALERGLFARFGLDVTLSREASWANIRDKVAAGLLDGAQMLASMPLATTLGLGEVQQATVTALSLDLNGNAITVGQALYDEMKALDPVALRAPPVTADTLKRVIQARRSSGRTAPVFATVFPFSTHNYLLRYWLASAGIDPDRDLRLVVIPPPQMVEALRIGAIEGFCVGEPWNAVAVAEGLGQVLATSHDIWNNHPEKVFGVNAEWAERHPATHAAVLKSLIEAARWLDEPAHRRDAAEILAHPDYVGAPAEIIAMSMTGSYRYGAGDEPRPMPDFNVFFRYAANFPWRSHALWLLTQMMRWGQIRGPLDLAGVARTVYRPDFYRAVVTELELPCPAVDAKTEGRHRAPWQSDGLVMGSDGFLDGRIFDPTDPLGYLRGFPVQRSRITPEDRT